MKSYFKSIMQLIIEQRGLKIQERHIKSTTWLASSPSVNPDERFGRKFEKIVHEKVPFTMENLVTAAQKS